MSIPNYLRPQEIIRQILEDTPVAAEPRTLHAFAFGPQFDLFRYTNAAERAAMSGVAFVENTSGDPDDRQLVAYEGIKSTHIADKAFSKLYGENLEGQLWVNNSSTDDYKVNLYGLDTPNKLRVTDAGTGEGVNVGLADDDLIPELYGRQLRAGDVIYATYGGNTVRRMISKVEKELVASHVGTNDDKDDGVFSAGSNNPSQTDAAAFSDETAPAGWTLSEDNAATEWSGLEEGSSYNGEYAERYTITVTKASVNGEGGRVRIRSASGKFSAESVEATADNDAFVIDHAALGGVIVRLTPDDLYDQLEVGDSFSFVVKGLYKPLVLTGGSKDLELVGSSEYTGNQDTRYVITVIQGVSVGAVNDSFAGATIRVTDTAGIDVQQEYVVAHGTEYALGTLGLRFQFPASVTTPSATHQHGLRTGDVYYIDAVSAKAIGPASVIVLSGQATNVANWVESDVTSNLFDIEARLLFTGYIDPKRNDAPDLAWTAEDEGIRVREALQLEVAGRTSNEWVDVKESDGGLLFAHWRGLVTGNSADTIKRYFSESELGAAFGAFDPDNPIGYGSVICMRGAQGKSIFAGRVKTNDVAGYTALLRQASRIDGIYSLSPASIDPAIVALCKQHVNDYSTETNKLWRRLYVGVANPGPYLVLAKDSDGNALAAEVQANANGNVRVVCPEAKFLTQGIQPGDLYRTNFVTDQWGDATYDEFEVETVADETELFLVTGPDDPISPAARFELWRPDTGLSQAQYVGGVANAMQDRRVVTVWTDTPLKRDADQVLQETSQMFEAMEVAGLRSALLPQQGLTNTEIDHSVDSAPKMFTKYTESELNVAASNGVMVITQDLEEGPIYIRHQLTTQTNKNALYWEDSVGTNLDSIAYGFKDLFQPYIGKRNVTPALVTEIYVKSQALLDRLKSPPPSAPNVGPQIIDYTALSVGIDANFKDRINVKVRVEIPLPLNTLVIELTAGVTSAETTVSLQTFQSGV